MLNIYLKTSYFLGFEQQSTQTHVPSLCDRRRCHYPRKCFVRVSGEPTTVETVLSAEGWRCQDPAALTTRDPLACAARVKVIFLGGGDNFLHGARARLLCGARLGRGRRFATLRAPAPPSSATCWLSRTITTSRTAVDARHAGDHDDIAPCEERSHRGESQTFDNVVHAGIFFDECVGARDIGLGLIEIEVADEVFDGVVRKKKF